MLKKAHRLSTKEFMDVMEKGRVYTSPLFVMRVLVIAPASPASVVIPAQAGIQEQGLGKHNKIKQLHSVVTQNSNVLTNSVILDSRLRGNDTKRGKISAVAPKKVAPTAVLRNKLRRQIYEAIYPLQNSLIPGVSAIVFAKPEMTTTHFKDIQADLSSLFSKAKISV